MVPSLSIVELKVQNWKAAIDWFHDIFCLPVMVLDNENQYALFGEPGKTRLSIKATSITQQNDHVLLQWQVTRLKEFVEILRRQQVKILKEVELSREGYTYVTIEGPEGLRMLLFETEAEPN